MEKFRFDTRKIQFVSKTGKWNENRTRIGILLSTNFIQGVVQ